VGLTKLRPSAKGAGISAAFRVPVLAVLLIGVATAARAEICVTIDTSRDTLAAQDQSTAVLLVTKEFELAGEKVAPAGCTTPFVLWHARLGDLVVVTMAGRGREWQTTARGLDDLPAAYSQMVRSIVTGRPMTGLSVVDRTNVTAAQSDQRRVHTDSLWYARIGYGSVFADRAYGTPAFGFGYRAELDAFAIDVSLLSFQIYSAGGYPVGPRVSAASFIKVSGLYFLSPTADRSGYVGAGLSYGSGSVTTAGYTEYWQGSGLQGELTAGYELARATRLRMFVQADAVLPFYKLTSQPWSRVGMGPIVTPTERRYAPSLVVSLGVGGARK
jgi:hypothetical protein